MKLIGVLLILLPSTLIGFDMSKMYGERVYHLRQLIQSLQMIETEMDYSQTTLHEVFMQISMRIDGPIHFFYSHLSEQLQHGVSDFLVIWDDEIEQLQKASSLNKSDLEILKQFGRNLGIHTFTQQQKHIHLSIHNLKGQLEEAKEERTKYEKMAKMLGFLIGLLVVIVLV